MEMKNVKELFLRSFFLLLLENCAVIRAWLALVHSKEAQDKSFSGRKKNGKHIVWKVPER